MKTSVDSHQSTTLLIHKWLASGGTAAICVFLMIWASSACADKISNHLRNRIAVVSDTTEIKVWVYFKDKDESAESYAKAAAGLTDRARRRRAHIPVDWYDLPVATTYVNSIAAFGGRDIHPVKWLNAVSARMARSQIEQAAGLDFILKIEPVETLIRKPIPETPFFERPLVPSLNYGASYTQIHMLGIDSLHRAGLTGKGVLIAFLDSGYLLSHPSLDSINVIFTYDFIHNKTSVDDEVNIGQTNHGTACLSACGGFANDTLIGPAYKADYILAKTEVVTSETQIEEDYWVRAADTADVLGADIISSSLGYNDWYTYADMNGHTAVTSIAAQIAASRGILVVVAAGNEGDNSWHYIDAPADADSIIAVGSVDADRIIASTSSYGPTYDGRIKPDMCAMGVSVYCASDAGGYTYKSGTSLAAPFIAGGAALVLEADSSLRGNPMTLRERLLKSCDRYSSPDYHNGYGLPNLIVAAGLGTLNGSTSTRVFAYGPNPFRDSLVITPTKSFPDGYKLEVFTLAGELVYQNFNPPGNIWYGTNQNGQKVASGAYIIRFSADGIQEKIKVFKI